MFDIEFERWVGVNAVVPEALRPDGLERHVRQAGSSSVITLLSRQGFASLRYQGVPTKRALHGHPAVRGSASIPHAIAK